MAIGWCLLTQILQQQPFCPSNPIYREAADVRREGSLPQLRCVTQACRNADKQRFSAVVVL